MHTRTLTQHERILVGGAMDGAIVAWPNDATRMAPRRIMGSTYYACTTCARAYDASLVDEQPDGKTMLIKPGVAPAHC